MDTTQNQSKIAVRDFNFYYGTFHALKNVNMDIPANKVTAFIGPSGCGKSTLLRTFNRMYDLYPGMKADGQLLLDGKNILDKNVDLNLLRAKVGMVFQKPTPFPMSIYDNVTFGVKLYESLSRSELDDRVEWALRKAALWGEVKDKLKQSGNSLSGGQQQRLCIARAVASKPEVVLLDEPTSALDVSVQASVLAMFTDLQVQFGFACLFISHDLAVIDSLAHRVVVMQYGKIVEAGTREDVLLNPQQEYTKRLLAAAPVPNPIEQRTRREERHALLESLGDRVVELDTRELL